MVVVSVDGSRTDSVLYMYTLRRKPPACILARHAAMKPEQLQVAPGIISGKEVIAVLPTGFGKSQCFACLQTVFDLALLLGEPSIVLVIVIAPLNEASV